MANGSIRITKLDAARRQLRTAIKLWFENGDPVSIHTLAHAAYEIIHVVSKQKNPSRPDLIFDSLHIREEKRAEFNIMAKTPGNFFKHAKKDASAEIDFNPAASEAFIVFAIFGLEACKESLNAEESAFMFWLAIHQADTLTEVAQKHFTEHVSVENLALLKSISKDQFIQTVYDAGRLAKRWG